MRASFVNERAPKAREQEGGAAGTAPPRHLQAVAEFGRYALWESDLDALLTEACAQVAKGLGVPYAKVLEHRAAENDLLIRAGVGWRPGVVGTVRAPAGRDHPPGLAIQTREPVVVADLGRDARFNPTPLFREYGVVSLINVPILLDDSVSGMGVSGVGVFGVLEVVTPERKDFSSPDISFLQNFANLIAGVVHRRRVEQSLQAALREREVLLRELQHRVKNNLYVVTSLLGLQANRIGDSAARLALEEVQSRVHAIGLAYGILQTSSDISRFDLGAYLAALCRTLLGTEGNGKDGIALALDLKPAQVTLQVGVPLGLIVNELVSNSIRHAFPDGHGTVSLAIRQDGNRIVLDIADDGRGMPAPGSPPPGGPGGRRPGTLGLTLVEALTMQIQGTLSRLPTDRGVRHRLIFTVPHD